MLIMFYFRNILSLFTLSIFFLILIITIMSVLRRELINAVVDKAYAVNIHGNLDKKYEFRKKMILDDKSLTNDEKSVAIEYLTESYDLDKIIYNIGKKRICENCQLECLGTSFCELCIRNYLKANFSNWSSGNNDIDHLIQNCQIETTNPRAVVEWIPYNNFQNINYLTKGGFSEIYTADWIDGRYFKWDSNEQQLKRKGTQKVILKRLENVKSANRNWFDEAKSHLSIGNKWGNIVTCFGLTQNPSNKDYVLVTFKNDTDLRNYLKQNHNQLTWKKRINISYDIIESLYYIHEENAIHRDLHSGNILYFKKFDSWYISDLGFCGPADKSLGSIYGNLPYIAPEVIAGKGYTFKSDIYSIGMLMWEISYGQIPFSNFEYSDYDLAMNIINGMRPKVGTGVPLEYKELMQQCWDADPEKRPDINTLMDKIKKSNIQNGTTDKFNANKNSNKNTVKKFFNRFNLFSKQKKNNSLKIVNETSNTNIETNYTSNRLFTSKVYQFENFPEPRNATEGEQEAFHSKTYSFSIPYNIDDFNDNSSNNQSSSTLKIIGGNSKNLSEAPNKKLQTQTNNTKGDLQNDYQKEMTQQIKKHDNSNIDDQDDIYNDPNLHAEEQDELEIPAI